MREHCKIGRSPGTRLALLIIYIFHIQFIALRTSHYTLNFILANWVKIAITLKLNACAHTYMYDADHSDEGMGGCMGGGGYAEKARGEHWVHCTEPVATHSTLYVWAGVFVLSLQDRVSLVPQIPQEAAYFWKEPIVSPDELSRIKIDDKGTECTYTIIIVDSSMWLCTAHSVVGYSISGDWATGMCRQCHVNVVIVEFLIRFWAETDKMSIYI
jgi:hypothetical protein